MTDLDDLEKKAREAGGQKWAVSDVGVGFEIEDQDGNVVAQAQQVAARDNEQRKLRAAHIAAANPSAILEVIAGYREAKKAAEFNFEQYQDASRLLNEECEKTERLQARVAELESQSANPVARTTDEDWSATGEGTWLGRVESHLPLPELTPLYLRAPQAVPEWQPIETAPNYKEVMVWPNPSDYCMTAIQGQVPGKTDRFGWYYCEYETGFGVVFHECYPTHWMPLPATPSPEEE